MPISPRRARRSRSDPKGRIVQAPSLKTPTVGRAAQRAEAPEGTGDPDRARRLGHRVERIAVTPGAPQRRVQRNIGFEYETSMALAPPRAKDVVIARGAGYDVRVDNADGQAVVEIVVDHQPETDDGRGAAEAALKAARSDLNFVNMQLDMSRLINDYQPVGLQGAAPEGWGNIDNEVNLRPSAEHKKFDTGALQATAGLTLPALAKVLQEDPTLRQGLEETWDDALTPEIGGKLFKGDNETIGSAAEAHPNLWPRSAAGVNTFVQEVVEAADDDIAPLDAGQKEQLTAVVVSMVRTPVIAHTMQGAPQYYKILAGNLLHKTDLATIWGILPDTIRGFVGRDRPRFIQRLAQIVAAITGKEIDAETPVIPATKARQGAQSRSPVLALQLGTWFTGIVANGVDRLTSASYQVDPEWQRHKHTEDNLQPPLNAPPKGWEKAGGSLDTLERMKQRVREGLEGFGDLNATDAPLVQGGAQRPLFEFRSIGKGTTLGSLPNTALAVWDYIALALGKAAGGPETVEEQADDDVDLDLPDLGGLLDLPAVGAQPQGGNDDDV